MAPELRKRKSVSDAQKPNVAAKAEKVATKGKRKAAEESSPVSLKKQKSVKKAAAATKPAKKPAQKPKKKEPVVEEVEVEAADEQTIEVPDESSDSEQEDGKEVQALVTELDSEDEDITNGDALFKTGEDVGKVPEVPKKIKQDATDSDEESGVLYIGRIPHGFYEHEMRQYFEQFGPINKLRLSRNKQTGASKHFAFVQFAEASTAEIVAKTMDNYLLFGHILKCRIIPKERVHEDLFKGSDRRYKRVPWNKMAGLQLQKPRTESDWADKVTREQAKRAKKAEKLKALGYDFDTPEIQAVPAPAAIENGETEVKAIEAAPVEKVEEKVEEKAEEKIEEKQEEEKPADPVKAPEPEPEVEIKTKAKAKGGKAKTAKGKASKAGRGKRSKA